ncbi:prepilin-type N-terminal cleavage/methylation domain-containing protein [Rheinheimera sp.]|uniref:prepilin-type N-terminal cleavage/methylation domain-containing protein n=1 Tax=Rheinheimera sp. TaxID=1869214 RepID=UPI002FDE01EC
MKKNQGFTLVELVIVIVILGILAITAAPKFLNLSGDAKASTLSALKGSLESANAMVYSKALLQSKEKDATALLTNPAVNVVYGYTAATVDDIGEVLDLATTEWTVIDDSSTTAAPANTVVITPEALSYETDATKACQLLYVEAASQGAKPTITLQTQGC